MNSTLIPELKLYMPDAKFQRTQMCCSQWLCGKTKVYELSFAYITDLQQMFPDNLVYIYSVFPYIKLFNMTKILDCSTWEIIFEASLSCYHPIWACFSKDQNILSWSLPKGK